MPTGIVARRSIEPDDLAELLSTRRGLIEHATSLQGHPDGIETEPYQYQATLLDTEGDLRWISSRQSGKSTGIAFDAFSGATLYSRDYPDTRFPGIEVLVSRNLDDAREKMRYIRVLHDSLTLDIRPRLVVDNTFEIEFANGGRIVAMAIPRGKGPANVRIDEFAYLADPAEVWRAALGMVALGGKVWGVSTPLGRGGLFHDFIHPEEGGDLDVGSWTLVSSPWWFCRGLCSDVAKARKAASRLATTERVERFGTAQLRKIFAALPVDDFRQEFECEFVDELTHFFPYDLLVSCTQPEPEMYSDLETFAAHKAGDVFVGVDIGRTRNTTEVSVFELLGTRLYQRVTATLENTPFAEQEMFLDYCVRVTAPVRMRIDRTGIGWELAENLAREHGGVVDPVNFTQGEKERMIVVVKKALENRNVSLTSDRDRLRQWHSIKREVRSSGFVYQPDVREKDSKGRKHHADQFWADALAISGAFGIFTESGFGSTLGEPR